MMKKTKFLQSLKNRKNLPFHERVEFYEINPYALTDETDHDTIFNVVLSSPAALKYCRSLDDSLRKRIITAIPATISQFINLSQDEQHLIIQLHPSYLGHIRNPIEQVQILLMMRSTDTNVRDSLDRILKHKHNTNRRPSWGDSLFLEMLANGFRLNMYSIEKIRNFATLRLSNSFSEEDIENELTLHRLYE